MNDEDVADLLDSDEPLIVIEAPAGCGKTFQGARYAQREVERMSQGRTLILTHTHAACNVFANATNANASKVEIRTIDGLVSQIAAAYHQSLGLPPDPSSWARNEPKGYELLADKVSRLIEDNPMIAEALANRFPRVVCDEHQDASESQHKIISCLHEAGAWLRIFGDPMQQIYSNRGQSSFEKSQARWQELRNKGCTAELEYPHRWTGGSEELGEWVLQARQALADGHPVDLTNPLPHGLRVVRATNRARKQADYQLSQSHRRPLDEIVKQADDLLILTDQNQTAVSLRAFWSRSIPLWEGHTRDNLATLVNALNADNRTAETISAAFNKFVYGIAVGYTASSHGKRLEQEIRERCQNTTRGKPALIQELAQQILAEPNHKGVATALSKLDQFRSQRLLGFADIKVDHRNELRDAIRLGEYDSPDEGLSELHRRRTYTWPSPPRISISTIHKAKGLECPHAILLPCDGGRFKDTSYARCKLYVALSRATNSLTLVVCKNDPGPLLRL